MSKATKAFFEELKKDLMKKMPGLRNFIPEVKAELKRLGTHGAVELAQGLFNGNAFTPYGPGSYSKEAKEQGMKMDGVQAGQGGIHGKEEPQQEQERGGREM